MLAISSTRSGAALNAGYDSAFPLREPRLLSNLQVSSEETDNRLIYELGNGQWNIPTLRTLLEDVIPTSSVFSDFEVEHTFPVIGRRVMLLNGRKLRPGNHAEFLVLASRDSRSDTHDLAKGRLESERG